MDVDEWDAYAAGWDEARGTRVYAEGAYRSLLDLLDAGGRSLEGLRVLDFGCGTGLLTEFLVHRVRSIDAVDTSGEMRRVISAKVHDRGWTNVAVHADAPPGEYDLIVCSSVLAFVDDYAGTVGRLAAVLAPGGLFVQWDWARDEEEPEAGGLEPDEMRRALSAAGLADVEVGVGFEASVDGAEMRPLIGSGRRPMA